MHKHEKIRIFFLKNKKILKLKKIIHIPFPSLVASVAKHTHGGPLNPPSSSCCNKCYKKNTRGASQTLFFPHVLANVIKKNIRGA
jgi:hypothetical protein